MELDAQIRDEDRILVLRRCIRINSFEESFDLVVWILFDEHTEKVYEAEVDKFG